ncbi:MAG: LamG domain-containing protein, partial [Chlorobiales bacterium]|nr:LamG domain-containing protein [Chlorobiales bacterium]
MTYKHTLWLFIGCLLLTGVAAAQTEDPIAWWKLDDGEGTVAKDSSGNGNDGTLAGDPTWVEGTLGGALDFDGNGDHVDCGNDAIFELADGFSLAVWINWRQRSGGWQAVVSKGDNSWRLARGASTSKMDFGFTAGGSRGWQAARTNSDVPLNE